MGFVFFFLFFVVRDLARSFLRRRGFGGRFARRWLLFLGSGNRVQDPVNAEYLGIVHHGQLLGGLGRPQAYYLLLLLFREDANRLIVRSEDDRLDLFRHSLRRIPSRADLLIDGKIVLSYGYFKCEIAGMRDRKDSIYSVGSENSSSKLKVYGFGRRAWWWHFGSFGQAIVLTDV